MRCTAVQFVSFAVGAVCLALSGCSNSEFASGSRAPQTPRAAAEDTSADDTDDSGDAGDADDADGADTTEVDTDASAGKRDDADALDEREIAGPDGPMTVKACSAVYAVKGRANPYLAGAADGTTIAYTLGQNDTAPSESPERVTFKAKDCLRAGAKLYFDVSGQINHGPGTPTTNADGNLQQILEFQKGAILGKSGIVAPMTSLLGVFVEAKSATSQTPPANLDFTAAGTREYDLIKPKLGQVFYIGDGKTATGAFQRVEVPARATEFYFGIMDTYGWWNNTGSLSGAVLWQP